MLMLPRLTINGVDHAMDCRCNWSSAFPLSGTAAIAVAIMPFFCEGQPVASGYSICDSTVRVCPCSYMLQFDSLDLKVK